MDFRYSAEDEAFRLEVKDFLDKNLPKDWLGIDPGPEEESREGVLELAKEMYRKMGEKGWVGLTWPKAYGGQEASLWKEMVLLSELAYRGSPGMDLAIAQADLILTFGTEEQKQRFIPPITRGEVKWAIGMSEPNAGTDTFNVQMRAVEQEDGSFILNGQKIWSSGAHNAKYEVCYTRTDPDNKHLGLSVFIVDLESPGVSLRQIDQCTGIPAFCEVFFDNVVVPRENMIGEKNGGWQILLHAFGAERTYGLFIIYNTKRYLEQLVEFCKETKVNGRTLGEDPVIRSRIAQAFIDIDVGINLGHELNWLASKGEQTIKTSSQIKVLGGELAQRVSNLGQQVLGLYGPLNEESKWTQIGGRFRHAYLSSLSFTMAGGTTETSKNHVAGRFGLGLPKQV